MSSLQNTMSEANALVERMGVAVRTAYKAIEVLKVENQNLKDENEALRKQVLLLGGSVVTSLAERQSDEHQTTNGRVDVESSSQMTSVSAHCASNEHEEEVPMVLPAKEYAPVINELGLVWQKPQRLGSGAVAASNIVPVLAELQPGNLHAIARYIHPVSTETMCRALFETVVFYIDAEAVSLWTANVTNWSVGLEEGNAVSVLPVVLLRKLDLLVSLLVSLCGRISKGLVAAHKIVRYLRKIIVGNIRMLLSTSHFAHVMGTLRCGKAETYMGSAATADTSNAAHEGGAGLAEGDEIAADHVSESEEGSSGSSSDCDDSMDSDGGIDDHDADGIDKQDLPCDTAQQQQQRLDKQRKAALSSMFGLDSDSDSEDADIKKEEEETGMFEGMTDDNAMLVEDQETPPLEAPAASNSAVEAGVAICTQDVSINVDQPAAKVNRQEDLETACRVYLLLTTLLRLRLECEIVHMLMEIWLTTAGNLSTGVIVGVVQVFGSERFQPPSGAAKDQLSRLLRAWYQDLQLSTSTAQSPTPSNKEGKVTTRVLQGMIEKLWRQLGRTDDIRCHLPAQPTHGLLPPLNINLDVDVSPETLEQLPTLFRKHGFWGSVNELVRRRTATSAAAVDCFATLGLDGVSGHSEVLCKILQAWEPMHTRCSIADSKDCDDLLTETIFVSGFVQSPVYGLSQAQHTVHQSLCASKILPTKLVAEDALVTQFTTYWRTMLTSHTDDAQASIWEDTQRALNVVKLLLDSFLATEYDEAEGGWRTGASGDAFRLTARLANRLAVAEVALKKLPLSSVPHFVPSSAHIPLKPSLQWLHYSSVTGHQLLHVAEFLDHCTRYVFAAGLHLHEEDSTIVETSESAVQLTVARKLHAACNELVCLLALSSVESLLAVLTGSLRGMLCAVRVTAQSPDSAKNIVRVLPFVQKTISALMCIPAPWSGCVRADAQHEVHMALKAISVARNLEVVPSSVRQGLVDLQSVWMLRQSDNMPIFVINLDKRTDRWRRTLVMLSPSGLSAVRVRAYDGTSDRSIYTPYASQQPGNQQGAAEASSLLIHTEDDYGHIPESDVQLTWDSTLNSTFDARCLANKAVACTTSERACAASHLRAWRAIAASRGVKSIRSKASEALVKANNRKSAGGAEPVQLVTTSPETIYKTLQQLHKAAHGGSSTVTKHSTYDVAESYLTPQEGSDYFIIIEDDVAFPQQSLVDLRATVRALMRTLPADVDVLYLSGVLPKDSPHFKLTHKKDDPFYGINYVWTLQAYVLRPRAVEVLLSKLPIWAPVDNFVASLIFNKELKASIVVDKLTHRLSTATMGVGKGKTFDSDVRPSGKSYSTDWRGAPRGVDRKKKDDAEKAGPKRKRTKLSLF